MKKGPAFGKGMKRGFGGPAFGKGMKRGFGGPAFGKGMKRGFGGPAFGKGMKRGFGGPAFGKGMKKGPAFGKGMKRGFGGPAFGKGMKKGPAFGHGRKGYQGRGGYAFSKRGPSSWQPCHPRWPVPLDRQPYWPSELLSLQQPIRHPFWFRPRLWSVPRFLWPRSLRGIW